MGMCEWWSTITPTKLIGHFQSKCWQNSVRELRIVLVQCMYVAVNTRVRQTRKYDIIEEHNKEKTVWWSWRSWYMTKLMWRCWCDSRWQRCDGRWLHFDSRRWQCIKHTLRVTLMTILTDTWPRGKVWKWFWQLCHCLLACTVLMIKVTSKSLFVYLLPKCYVLYVISIYR